MRKESALVIIMILATQLAAMQTTLATHSATIEWVKPQSDSLSYPPMPGTPYEYYWNGITDKWINFTVRNNGQDPIREIKVIFEKYGDGNTMFNFSETSQSKAGWYATPDEFGPNKRPTVLYFRTDGQFIGAGETVTFGLYMTEGPEECRHNIDFWTVDAGTTPITNFYELWIIVDKHMPDVPAITSPQNGSSFHDESVEVNAIAPDTQGLHQAGVKNVTLHVSYEVEAGKYRPPDKDFQMKYNIDEKLWYAILDNKTDLVNEGYHHCTLKNVYDWAENGPVSNTTEVVFFWFTTQPLSISTVDPCFLNGKSVGHVGSNVHGSVETGFKPDSNVTVTMNSRLIGAFPTDHWGGCSINFKIPEIPRGLYKVRFTQNDITPPIVKEYDFTVIPWMQISGANMGHVGTKATVKGSGFAANIDVDVIYRDVSFGNVYGGENDWAMEWSDEATRFMWQPYLGNLTVGRSTTNSNGTFTLTFDVPESYGGNHPIFGQEVQTRIRSGWMPAYPEAALFNVLTNVSAVPATGLSGQFVQIYTSGLPLPEYHSKTYDCRTNQTRTVDHEKFLALDFGSNRYWVFEKGFILNNEFDYAWAQKLYLPLAYWFNHDDPRAPTWNGTLYWMDAEEEFHLGSQFLKVPALAPGDYEVALYQFDRSIEADEKDFLATAVFAVIKDPLYVRVNSGTLYFKGEKVTVYAEIDLDGRATNPTDTSFAVYHESQFLMTLTPQPISEGLYAASFTCPDEKGSYFIKVNATKELEGMTLRGFGTASFVVSTTLDGFNATLTSLKDGLATINTNVGTIKVDVANMNGKLVTLEESIATIKTDIGTLKADLASINTQVTAIGADNVIIKTSVGELEGKITGIRDNTVDIQTKIGKMSTTTDSIQNQTGLQQTGIALSLIAAVAAIIAAILVFRKLYK